MKAMYHHSGLWKRHSLPVYEYEDYTFCLNTVQDVLEVVCLSI
jgi:hypothetical protein